MQSQRSGVDLRTHRVRLQGHQAAARRSHWLLENGKGALLEDGKCIEVKTGNETGSGDGEETKEETIDDEIVEEETGDDGAADDGAGDDTATDDGAAARRTGGDDDAAADDGTTTDDSGDDGAADDAAGDDSTTADDSTVIDSVDQPEVLGETVARQETQLARTGFDAGDIMLFGTVLLGSGLMLVSSPALRRKLV